MDQDPPAQDSVKPAEPAKAVSAPRPVYYRSIEISPSTEDPRRLVFVAPTGAPEVPEELLLMRQDYEKTARVASVLLEDDLPTRKAVFDLLHQAADRGFRGPAWSIADGKANLAEVRDAIVDYAHPVRTRLLKQYTVLLVCFGVTPLLLGALIYHTGAFGLLSKPAAGGTFDPTLVWVIAACWIPAGAAFCVWGEFALRMQSGLTYDQLLVLDPSRWRPGQRLLITVVIAFIFAFLLAFDAVQVGLGSLLLNDFAKKSPAMALAVGGITGLAFASVQDILFRIKPTQRAN